MFEQAGELRGSKEEESDFWNKGSALDSIRSEPGFPLEMFSVVVMWLLLPLFIVLDFSSN